MASSSFARAVRLGLGILPIVSAPPSTAVSLVTVDNPGNPADSTPSPSRGSVAYTFEIGTTEVTNEEYARFLNAVASVTDPHGLWDPRMEDAPGGGIVRTGTISYTYTVKRFMNDVPVVFVSAEDACRFCNWLHNGEVASGNGDHLTETGSFDLGAVEAGTISRSSVASYVLPTVDEWHKAAWHDPVSAGADTQGTANYWAFPTGSDTPPSQALASATGSCTNPGLNVVNFANGAAWNGVTGAVIRVKTAGNRSHYGAYDMAGNAAEIVVGPDGSAALMGGHARSLDAQSLHSAQIIQPQTTDADSAQTGFRVALIDPQSRYVAVGSPGNPGHPTRSWGSVPSPYFLGRWEVTNSEWIGFLNSVATGFTLTADPHGLFDPRMASDLRGGITRKVSNTFPTRITSYEARPNMGSKPVNFITYYDALRYCNWLHHGQPTGNFGRASTEFGAYTLSAQAEAAGAFLPRQSIARFWLPSLDEWFKAAFYLSRTQSYRVYPVPVSSGSFPAVALATALGGCRNPEPDRCNIADGAVWGGVTGHLLTVGSTSAVSPYGAYDMGGNVQEWTATPIDAELRVMGGYYNSQPILLATTVTELSQPPGEATASTGLRVAASVPDQDMSRIDIQLDPDPPPDSPFVHWIVSANSQYGARYQLELSPGTGSWQEIGRFQNGTGDPLQFFGGSLTPTTLIRVRRR